MNIRGSKQSSGLLGAIMLGLTGMLGLLGVLGALWFTWLGIRVSDFHRDVTSPEVAASVHARPGDFVRAAAQGRSFVHQSAVTLISAGTAAIRLHLVALLCCGAAYYLLRDRRVLYRVLAPLVAGGLLSLSSLLVGRNWKAIIETATVSPVPPSPTNILSELQSSFGTVWPTAISFAIVGLLMAATLSAVAVNATRYLVSNRRKTQ